MDAKQKVLKKIIKLKQLSLKILSNVNEKEYLFLILSSSIIFLFFLFLYDITTLKLPFLELGKLSDSDI